MNEMICDFYTKVDIGSEVVNKIITISKTSKPRKSINRSMAFACACVAVLAVSVIFVFLFRMGGFSSGGSAFTYANIEKFSTTDSNGNNDVLISHDGVALWIEGAYFNGSQMYAAVKGEYHTWEWDYESAPDTLKYQIEPNDGSYFKVNDKEVNCANSEITLVKNGEYFEGVVQLNVDIDESVVYLKMNLPAFRVYSNGLYVKSVYGPFDMENSINRIYTMNEENLMNGGNEIYIEQIVYFRGINIQYVVPKSIVNISDTDIGICAYNEDGSEIALYGKEKRLGDKRYVLFVNPKSRHICVVLYKTNGSTTVPIQEYEVTLNAPNRFHTENVID